MVSSNASLSYQQIAEARLSPDQPLFFQLYKHSDEAAKERIREVEKLGYNAIFLTVDAVIAGYRERDIRAPFELEEQEREAAAEDRQTKGEMPRQPEDTEKPDILGTAGALLRQADLDMTWKRVSHRAFTLSIELYERSSIRLYLGFVASQSCRLSLKVR